MAAGSVISLGIQVDGENTFKSALGAIDAEIKSLGAGVEAATASMGKMGDNEEAAAKKSELLARQIEANKEKLSILSQQYDSANKRLQELAEAMEKAKQSGDPEAIEKATNAYNKQSVQVSKLSEAMSKTESAIAKASQAMESGEGAADDETKALDGTASASKSLEEKIDSMSKIMQTEFVAKAAGMAIDAAKALVNAFIDAGKAVAALVVDAGHFADDLATLSATTGVSTEKLQEWTYASNFIDTSVDTITGSLTKLTTQMASGAKGFEELGIATKNADGSMRDAESVFWDAIDALGQVQNATERDQLAMSLFGKSAKDLNPLIDAGSQAFRDLGKEAHEAGIIIGDEAIGKLGNFDDANNKLKANVEAAQRAIAIEFADMATGIANDCTDIVQAFVGCVKGVDGSSDQLSQRVGKLVQDVTKQLIDMLPTILKTGIDIIKSLVKGIVDNKEELMKTIKSVITELIKAIVQLLPDIISMGVDLIVALVEGIIDALPKLAASAPQIIAAIVEGVMKLMGKLPELGKKLIEGLWEGIKGAIGWLWDKIKSALGSVFGWVLDLLGIHSPSTVMRDKVGKMLGLGMAEGIEDSADLVQKAYDDLMPDPARLTAQVDGVSVAARVSSADSAVGAAVAAAMRDDRPIILTLNDRELGRAVRGYA